MKKTTAAAEYENEEKIREDVREVVREEVKAHY